MKGSMRTVGFRVRSLVAAVSTVEVRCAQPELLEETLDVTKTIAFAVGAGGENVERIEIDPAAPPIDRARAHQRLLELDAELRKVLEPAAALAPNRELRLALSRLLTRVMKVDVELVGEANIYGPSVVARLAREARRFIGNDPTELREVEIANAIVSVTDPEVDVVTAVANAIRHRRGQLGLLVTNTDAMIDALVAVLRAN